MMPAGRTRLACRVWDSAYTAGACQGSSIAESDVHRVLWNALHPLASVQSSPHVCNRKPCLTHSAAGLAGRRPVSPCLAGALQVEVAAASNAFGQCGGKLRQVALVESYSPEGQRTAVVVAKVGHTQKRYPRVPGTPNKKPL